MKTPFRVRFSPSPTGFLHIGGARTAFWDYLLARNTGGQFILRIEDTDQERRVAGAVRYILNEFEAFGIYPDEGPSPDELRAIGEDPTGLKPLGGPYGPYVQSLRREHYHRAAEELVAKGLAYRCDCTAEMLERERLDQMARRELPGYSGYCRTRNVSADKPHVIRFKMPTRVSVTVNDYLRGPVQFDSASLRDPVLVKSDGLPTYHLAVVVDDIAMKISHVLRGEEWLSTAPLHVLLYQAFNATPPVFVHLPVILAANGKKLSKRDGSVACHEFREKGYLTEALLNFTTLVGWSPGSGENQEIFSRGELEQRFSLDGINKASGVFDYQKLDWMNGMYLRALGPGEFLKRARPFIEGAKLPFDEQKLNPIAPLVRDRVKTLAEVPGMVEFLLVSSIERQLGTALQKGIDAPKAVAILKRLRAAIESSSPFEAATIEERLRPVADEFQLKLGPLLGVLRVALTGKTVSPPLFESIAVLGKEETLRRIDETIPLYEREVRVAS